MATENEKGVEVKDGRSSNVTFHKGADQISVSEGHLYVRVGSDVRAIHAPGDWRSVKIKD